MCVCVCLCIACIIYCVAVKSVRYHLTDWYKNVLFLIKPLQNKNIYQSALFMFCKLTLVNLNEFFIEYAYTPIEFLNKNLEFNRIVYIIYRISKCTVRLVYFIELFYMDNFGNSENSNDKDIPSNPCIIIILLL